MKRYQLREFVTGRQVRYMRNSRVRKKAIRWLRENFARDLTRDLFVNPKACRNG